MKTNYENYSMLDMIFEHRNKAYGAYALRNNYNSRISRALLISITSLIVLFTGKYLADVIASHRTSTILTDGIHDLIPPVILESKPVEMPKPKPAVVPQSQAIHTEHNVEMNVVQNQQAQDSIPTVEQQRNAESGLEANLNGNLVGATDGKGNQASFVPEPEPAPVSSEPIFVAEVMPTFPGGEKALMEFLSSHTEYPTAEKDMRIEGKVVSQFTVNEDGSIADIKILKSPSKGFDREVARVIKMMPLWKPGMQHGRQVKVRFVLPFTFSVNDY